MADKEKILVVEDNDFVRMQIIRFLTEENYEVIEAADGQEAVDKVKEAGDSIALAIVDVRMEPIDGFEFIRITRGLDINIPVILVTGDNSPDLLNEAGKWDITVVLMKPVQRERLIKTVDRTIQTSKRSA